MRFRQYLWAEGSLWRGRYYPDCLFYGYGDQLFPENTFSDTYSPKWGPCCRDADEKGGQAPQRMVCVCCEDASCCGASPHFHEPSVQGGAEGGRLAGVGWGCRGSHCCSRCCCPGYLPKRVLPPNGFGFGSLNSQYTYLQYFVKREIEHSRELFAESNWVHGVRKGDETVN